MKIFHILIFLPSKLEVCQLATSEKLRRDCHCQNEIETLEVTISIGNFNHKNRRLQNELRTCQFQIVLGLQFQQAVLSNRPRYPSK